jgi:hypothetical protein
MTSLYFFFRNLLHTTSLLFAFWWVRFTKSVCYVSCWGVCFLRLVFYVSCWGVYFQTTCLLCFLLRSLLPTIYLLCSCRGIYILHMTCPLCFSRIVCFTRFGMSPKTQCFTQTLHVDMRNLAESTCVWLVKSSLFSFEMFAECWSAFYSELVSSHATKLQRSRYMFRAQPARGSQWKCAEFFNNLGTGDILHRKTYSHFFKQLKILDFFYPIWFFAEEKFTQEGE